MTANSTLLFKRSENLDALQDQKLFDLLIVGGGIHGACAARIAARQGWKVALLEKSDYASATSSRSSKMIHGGLRYLELFDFKQVFEGIRARDALFKSAAHLVKPYPFLIPVKAGSKWERLRFKIGLTLYDLLLKDRSLRHRWLKRESLTSLTFNSNRSDLAGCFQYTDGLANDTRLVLENIVDARAHGAVTLNYCKVINKEPFSNGEQRVIFQDTLTQKEHTLSCRLVMNCAGPWAPMLFSQSDQRSVAYSSGAHLLFPYRWRDPALFLPLPGKSRYYFVWPHPAGTMVGTTEHEVFKLPKDPQPLGVEIGEIFKRITKDIASPDLGECHYAFSGIRILALRDNAKDTSQISRKHIWKEEEGVLNLIGGKLTTALWTVEEGLKKAAATLQLPYTAFSHTTKLPGGNSLANNLPELLSEQSIPPETISRLLSMYGSRIDPENFDFTPVTSEITAGELNLAINEEQVETVEDLMRRRLNLEYMPGNGLDQLNAIATYLKVERPGIDLEQETEHYTSRISKIHRLIKDAKSTSS